MWHNSELQDQIVLIYYALSVVGCMLSVVRKLSYKAIYSNCEWYQPYLWMTSQLR
jgi:hypothetical protein